MGRHLAHTFLTKCVTSASRNELFDLSQTEDGLKTPFPELAASKSAAIRVAVASIFIVAAYACLGAREDVATPFVGTVEPANEFELLNPKSAVVPDVANVRNGITEERIFFGQSAAFSGPASGIGLRDARRYIGGIQRGEREGWRSRSRNLNSRFGRCLRTRSRNCQYRLTH